MAYQAQTSKPGWSATQEACDVDTEMPKLMQDGPDGNASRKMDKISLKVFSFSFCIFLQAQILFLL
jgi:hypothetical protein